MQTRTQHQHPERIRGSLRALGACANRLISSDRDFEPYSGHCRQSAIPVNVRSAARGASG